MTLEQKQALSLIVISAICDDNMKKNGRKDLCGVNECLQQERTFSDMKLLNELRENNPNDYRNYLRMDDKTFNYLLEKIRPCAKKKDTILRRAITAEQRLVATLRYLATERTLEV